MVSKSSDFVARFFIQDQVSHRLGKMEQAAQTFATRMATVSRALTAQGTRLSPDLDFQKNVALQRAFEGIGPSPARDVLERELADISHELVTLGQTGKVSANQIQGLNARLDNTARLMNQLGAPAGGIRSVQRNLARLTSGTRLWTEENNNAARSSMFLRDATDMSRAGVTQMASASQGLMLGMSALDGNIQHLAFSLIFLQFAGALKTALSFGVLTLAIGGSVKMIQKWLESQKKQRLAQAQWRILTDNIDAHSQALELAEKITEKLGIQQKHTGEFTEALTKGMLMLREAGMAFDDVQGLKVFSALLMRAYSTTEDWGQATEDSLGHFRSWLTQIKDGIPAAEVMIDVGEIDPLTEAELFQQGNAAAMMLIAGFDSSQEKGLFGKLATWLGLGGTGTTGQIDAEQLGKEFMGSLWAGFQAGTLDAEGQSKLANALKQMADEANNEETKARFLEMWEAVVGEEQTGVDLFNRVFGGMDTAITETLTPKSTEAGTAVVEGMNVGLDGMKGVDIVTPIQKQYDEIISRAETTAEKVRRILASIATQKAKAIADAMADTIPDIEEKEYGSTMGPQYTTPHVDPGRPGDVFVTVTTTDPAPEISVDTGSRIRSVGGNPLYRVPYSSLGDTA